MIVELARSLEDLYLHFVQKIFFFIYSSPQVQDDSANLFLHYTGREKEFFYIIIKSYCMPFSLLLFNINQ